MQPAELPPDPPSAPSPGPPCEHAGGSAWRYLREGVRLALLRPPPLDAPATLGTVLALALVGLLTRLGFDLVAADFRGGPNLWALPEATLFVVIAIAGAAAFATLGRRSERGLCLLATLLALWLVVQAVALLVHALVGAWAPPKLFWRLWNVMNPAFAGWLAVAAGLAGIRLAGIQGPPRRLGAAVTALLFAFALRIGGDAPLWSEPYDQDVGASGARMALATEQAFYQQPRLLERELEAVAPGRPGIIDLYFVGAAGYANQDVFMREVRSAAKLFEERFDSAGRSVSLINNGHAVMDTPLASLTSLRRTLARVGQAMDRDEDVLFLFLTSHGSPSHELSLEFWPLRFEKLGPQQLKAALDEAGIKWRVVVVSACYSGGFVAPLADDHTLVITAAAADRQSFGCSNEAAFTYFGKAYFDEALRESTSFVQAFERARAAVAARETAEGQTPSNPQMHAGAAIVARLDALEVRLAGRGAPDVTAAPAAPERARYDALVKTIDPAALARAQRRTCVQIAASTGPDWTFQRAPEWFGGAHPGTPQWSKFVAAHEELYEAQCDSVSPELWQALQLEAWQKRLPAEHAEAALPFFATEPGRAFVQALQDTELDAQRAAVSLQIDAGRAATERYIARMRAMEPSPAK